MNEEKFIYVLIFKNVHVTENMGIPLYLYWIIRKYSGGERLGDKDKDKE